MAWNKFGTIFQLKENKKMATSFTKPPFRG